MVSHKMEVEEITCIHVTYMLLERTNYKYSDKLQIYCADYH